MSVLGLPCSETTECISLAYSDDLSHQNVEELGHLSCKWDTCGMHSGLRALGQAVFVRELVCPEETFLGGVKLSLSHCGACSSATGNNHLLLYSFLTPLSQCLTRRIPGRPLLGTDNTDLENKDPSPQCLHQAICVSTNGQLHCAIGEG